MLYKTRCAEFSDVPAITRIYNDGIGDRVATLETTLRTENDWVDVTIMEKLLDCNRAI